MSKIIYILSLIMAITFSSCEKVVKLDLKNGSNGIVVQGNINNLEMGCVVQLNGTINYYDSNNFPILNGATVSISDSAGNTKTLNQNAIGNYQLLITGIPGRTYILKINYEGKEYTSSSTMPYPVPIDSLTFSSTRNNGYRMTCHFTDPGGISNYYMIRYSSKLGQENFSTNARVIDDRLTDGQPMAMTVRANFTQFDTVTVNLECIDKGAFEFYNTLANAQGDLNPLLSSPPANPVSNISNGGLGYFSAYSYTQKKVAVK